jgi:hypothetical protein
VTKSFADRAQRTSAPRCKKNPLCPKASMNKNGGKERKRHAQSLNAGFDFMGHGPTGSPVGVVWQPLYSVVEALYSALFSSYRDRGESPRCPDSM